MKIIESLDEIKDLGLIEPNSLIRGDCLDVMKYIPDKSVDMILADLPYGTTKCKWDQVIPFDKLWPEYKRLIKDNGAIVLFGSEPFSSYLRLSNLKMYKYDFKWIKQIPSNYLNAKKQPLRSYEDICVFYKKQSTYTPILIDKPKSHIRQNSIDIKVKNNGVVGKVRENIKRNESRIIPLNKNYPNNVLNFDIMAKNKRIHLAQKPVKLLEYLIKTYTIENETILDNTMGSGSTGVACKNTNRNFIGIEKDCPKDGDKHFRTAIKRITEAKTFKFNSIID